MTNRLTEQALGGVQHALIFGNPVSTSSVRSLVAEVREHRATIERVRAIFDQIDPTQNWSADMMALTIEISRALDPENTDQ